MKKTDIYNLLQPIGFGKIRCSSSNVYGTPKIAKGTASFRGVLIKSHSPMDCFSCDIEGKASEIFGRVKSALPKFNVEIESRGFMVLKKGKQSISFITVDYPTYHDCNGDYISTWLQASVNS